MTTTQKTKAYSSESGFQFQYFSNCCASTQPKVRKITLTNDRIKNASSCAT